MSLLEDAVPMKFPWRTSPRKRPAPSPRTNPITRPSKTRFAMETTVEQQEVETNLSDSLCAPASVEDDRNMARSEGTSQDKNMLQELCDSLNNDLRNAQKEVLELREKLVVLKQEMEEASKEIETLRAEITRLSNNHSKLEARMFSLENLAKDDSISFYTGFPNIQALEATFKYLRAGENGENIRYWRSVDHSVERSHYEVEQQTQNKRGRPRTMNPKEEFFMVMCRLRQAFPEKHLGFLFGVSQSTVSRILISWINFMFLRFGSINIWPTREEVDQTMPEDFKIKYPNTRVIIDCTEVKCQMPSSLLLNSELFSSYKNHTKLKGLVGISPSGAFTFFSQLYTGSISDRAIVERCGILDLPFNDNDCVMADKGFTIDDILPLGVSLNIPPFLGQFAQMPGEAVVETQQIAGLRINVERAINKIRNFHIWDRIVPMSLFGIVNQMWAVCAFLCNIQDPILSE